MIYYFVVKSKDTIETDKTSKITEELAYICNESDSELEEIENHGKYVLVKILVSIEYAIGNVIDKLTAKCSFLDEEYICTNAVKLTKEFIEKWMNDELE